jgi:hypothetical protein
MDDNPQIDPQQLRGLAMTGATDQEIADFLQCPMERLQPFAALLTQARANRHIALRKKQFALAVEGSTSMLIFLGKHELGQTDQANSNDDWPEPQLGPKVG